MADNDTPKLRYDDFIGNVQPDPAKPEATIMLSGFVGHGPEGHARVYPDPTLGTWYDIPESDVVHSMPIPDSKLGGSYIWVRGSSEIKPGSTGDEPHAQDALPRLRPTDSSGSGRGRAVAKHSFPVHAGAVHTGPRDLLRLHARLRLQRASG
jgi:hypothetical protein